MNLSYQTVYFIREKGGRKLFKIGVTRGDAEERKKKLQTGNPRTLIVFAVLRVEDGFWYESYLHSKFKEKRVRGEWFRVTKKDIREACGKEQGYEEYESSSCCFWWW